MLPKKYHAIAFVSILVMLLLLGLQLLGFGFSSSAVTSGGDGASTAAAATRTVGTSTTARGSSALSESPSVTQTSSSVAFNQSSPTSSPNSSGWAQASNQSIQLQRQQPQPTGSGQLDLSRPTEFPLDHYHLQQQQQQQQLQQQQQRQLQNQPGQRADDFFRHFGLQFPMAMPAPPPLPGSFQTSQQQQQLPPFGPLAPSTTRAPFVSELTGSGVGSDSLPSASSGSQESTLTMPPPPPPQPQPQSPAQNSNSTVNEVGSPVANFTGSPAEQTSPHQLPAQLHQPPQFHQVPLYYTPPILTLGAGHPNRGHLVQEPQLQQQQLPVQMYQQPLLGVPEAPLTVEEYNARQTQLRPQQQPQLPAFKEILGPADRYGKRLPVGTPSDMNSRPGTGRAQFGELDGTSASPGLSRSRPDEFQLATRPPSHGLIRPPYVAQQAYPNDFEQLPVGLGMSKKAQQQAPPGYERATDVSAKLLSPPQTGSGARTTNQQPIFGAPSSLLMQQQQQQQQPQLATSSAPLCVRQQQSQSIERNSIDTGNTSLLAGMTASLCNEDPEYPTRDVMRAIEIYANERPIEHLFPQSLVQLHLAQVARQTGSRGQAASSWPLLDPFQPSIQQSSGNFSPNNGANSKTNSELVSASSHDPQTIGPSWSNFDSMCRSSVYMSQPRRAKNLSGQWKIVVNLPGHKYRNIAISQMARIEECLSPHSDCGSSPSSSSSSSPTARTSTNWLSSTSGPLSPKSQCLQRFDNQRLVAWSNQQGLHVDIFRLPTACSCHTRR